MLTIEGLKRKIQGTEDLRSVVRTMKALAAVSIRQYEKAVESLEDYYRTVEMGLQVLLKNRPDVVAEQRSGIGGVGAIIFGSDQGMVGQFNENIISYAFGKLDQFGVPTIRRSVYGIGTRLIGSLEGREYPLDGKFRLPGSVVGITPAVQELLVATENWREERKLSRIVVFYNKPKKKSGCRPYYIQLWPVDPHWFWTLERREWPTNMLPTFTMSWHDLFSSLVRQYLFVTLYRAYAESLASENSSRLASMQAAEKNIDEGLAELSTEYQHQRQEAITSELLDIVSGFKALTSRRAVQV